jgi:hypothetical protein
MLLSMRFGRFRIAGSGSEPKLVTIETRKWLRPVSLSIVLVLWLGSGNLQGQSVIWRADGASGDRLGIAVTNLGDLDRDGIADFLGGGIQVNWPSPSGNGYASVYSGRTRQVLARLAGPSRDSWFGASASALGDLDGDGISDFSVGAPRAGSAGEGVLYLYSGASRTLLRSITGFSPNSSFGWCSAGLGDINGDGHGDIAVGAPNDGVSGRVHVLTGPTFTVRYSLDGPGSLSNYGQALQPLGDLNGDQIVDFAVAAYNASPSGLYQAGQVFVVSGAQGLTLRSHRGNSPGESFGHGLASADVDGDGMQDVITGAPRADSQSAQDVGRTQIYSGRSGLLLSSAEGSAPNQQLGWTVGAGPDIDADGWMDYLACLPVLNEIAVISSRMGVIRSRLPGVNLGLNREVGWSIACVGDINADGMADMLLGSRSSGQTNNGAVVLASLLALPQGALAFGSGCTTPLRLIPTLLFSGDIPRSSGSPYFSAHLLNTRPGTIATLFIGASSQSWNGASLPLDLRAFGLIGCSLHISVDGAWATSTSPGIWTTRGTAFWSLGIPRDPSLQGSNIFLQAFIPDAAPSVSPASMTAPVQLLIH